MAQKILIHYGCGRFAPETWQNYDASPTLRIQQIPLVGRILRPMLNCVFPDNVKLGNIVKGLPVPNNTADAVFCSHVLEHLSLEEFRIAIRHTYDMLAPGGVFRCVVPDLEWQVRQYLEGVEKADSQSAITFMGDTTLLGKKTRKKGLWGMLHYFFSNVEHLWMWDYHALANELSLVGFTEVRRCQYQDSEEQSFLAVEDKERFEYCLAIECRK